MDIKEYHVNLNSKIEAYVLDMKRSLKTVVASNQGGWQGVLTHNKLPWAEELKTIIETTTGKTTRRFWFNVNGPGHFNNWHRHFNNCHVAVLYIKVPDNSGNIEFREHGNYMQITPTAGTLLLFPGTLEHRVLPNQSNDFRISLATNVV